MANNILTIDMVTTEALRVLHQELRLIPKVRRDYDDRFARKGAQIGDTLRIRKPAKYLFTSGRTLQVQESQEQYAQLPITNQGQISMSFSSAEMTLDINDYSTQFIRPAMKQMAASIESEFAVFMKNQIFWLTGSTSANLSSMQQPLLAKRLLDNSLAPSSPRAAVLNTLAQATLIPGLATLFNAAPEISKQYKEGEMGRQGGFTYYESSLMPTHTNGTASVSAGQYVASGSSGTTLIADTLGNATTVTAGSVFTIANVYAVHPESKRSLGYLQQFVVTADALANSSGGGTAELTISPEPIATGPFQNVDAAPVDNAALTFVGTASGTYDNSFFFHPDSFAFATADLDLPPNVDASRRAEEGLSLRALRVYDPQNDASIIRLDCLYGFCALYPQLAAKVINSATYVAP